MSDRYTARDVRGIFQTYMHNAAQLGYDVTEWNLKITTGPLLITARKGQTGPNAFEALPGLPLDLPRSYRDAYNSISTASLTMHDLADNRPQAHARSLYQYRVGGRYNTHYIDMYYDEKRDGSYSQQIESAIEEGSRKRMQRLVNELNRALSTDPTKPAHHDKAQYRPAN